MDLEGTIVALSSGRPPSAIAVVRVSGPRAFAVADAFGAHGLPPRRAVLRSLASPVDGAAVDKALCLAFPAPASATGEDVVELHCHGGPAVVERVLADAVSLPGIRLAEPGEFTLRAVLSGRMGLVEAEALAELIAARSEAERRRAVRLAEGALSQRAQAWRDTLVALSAEAEARIDFADEGDVPQDACGLSQRCTALADDVEAALRQSRDAGKLTDGFRIVLVGPPNAGKSSLLNALAGRDAAIVADEAGTTRDVVTAEVELGGYRVTLCDTAGLRTDATGVEAIGIGRTRREAATADLVVAVRSPDTNPVAVDPGAVLVWHKADLAPPPDAAHCATSLAEPLSIARLSQRLTALVREGMQGSEAAIVTRSRQRSALVGMVDNLRAAAGELPLELVAEALRLARHDLSRMTGEIGIEDVLDDVFGRFCIGK